MDPIEFTVVTYNIDSRKLNREERLKAFLEKISLDPPDVVVIQEGCRITYEKLLREMGVLGYKKQLLDAMNSRETGEMIFSKFPLSDGKYFQFRRTAGNRGVSCAKLDIRGTNVWICTSQFNEQTSLYRIQIKELNTTLHHLSKDELLIFAGDTRISEYQKDLTCPEGWYDTWYESGDEKNKFTYDSKTNLLVKPPYMDRPDRIWVRPSLQGEEVGNVECLECKLYGNDSSVTISSHYGVMAKFRIKI